MARLDRLAPAKEVAQAGAVIGREFSHRLPAAVLDLPHERLDTSLDELVRSELVTRRGIAPEASYTFKHALIRDTAYNSLLKSQRVLRHGQIAAAIESLVPETAATQPELLAQHHQEAGNTQQAMEQWSKAGKLAMSRGANREGAASFERALALLDALAETTQTMSDALDLRIALGPALAGLYGPGAEQTESSYRQALALAERLGINSSRLFPVLWGLYYGNWQRGRYAEARQAAGRLLDVARRGDDSGQLVEAHHALWVLLIAMGRPLEALVHLEQGGMLYDPDRHAALRYHYGGHDPGACCLCFRSATSWLLGYPDRASHEVAATLARVDELQHPMTLVVLLWPAWVLCQRGDRVAAAAIAERIVRSGEQYGFAPWASSVAPFVELASGRQATPERLCELHRSVMASASSRGFRGAMCCILIEKCTAAGDPESALRLLTPMLGESADMHRAELHRLEGSLLLQRAVPDAGAAERCFEQAIEVAREQSTKSFELRAATSLARLWQSQGKRDEARRLLGDIYGWFSEGFDTADLKNAKALLDELDARP